VGAVVYQPVALWPAITDSTASAERSDWLCRFHDGDRAIIEEIYRRHFDAVGRAVASLLNVADREAAIQEIFLRLLTRPALRSSFQGGDLGAWLTVVVRNHAIDCARHRSREVQVDADAPASDGALSRDRSHDGLEAKLAVDRFRREALPAKWAAVFEARFIRQLSQDEAASALGLGRTTLAYQEARVRGLLRRFLLRGGR
jgi:RNA polymerase sigma-70 factor (ECF subfamily)